MKFCKNSLFFIFLFFLTACTAANQKIKTNVDLGVNAVKALNDHTREFEKKIYKVTDNVYTAVGFGLANSTLIEGKDGVIIVDTMESVQRAEEVLAAFRKITNKPVKAIIYTHNHVDHIMGAKVMADGGMPYIYAHETTDYYVQRLLNKMRPIIGTRSMRMFGNYLGKKELANCGIGPYLGINPETTSGYLRPTKAFKDNLEIKIAGVKIKLIHAPGETNDQIYIYMAGKNLLICGDNYYKGFPNLYTIRGTPFRSLEQWYKSLDIIREIKPEFLIPCHSRPILSKNKIYNIITEYRDAIQFVHDQGIRGINQGMTPDELVEYIKLPPNLASSPYLTEFYGKVSWSLRSLFSGNLGWFSGDSADLQPVSRHKRDLIISDLAGGEEKLIENIKKYYEKKEYQAALQLTGPALRLYPGNKKAEKYRINSLLELGRKEINSNARHYYLTEALEINEKKLAVENTTIDPEQLKEIPLKSFFSMLSVCLDSKKVINMQKKVSIHFTDNKEIYSIIIRNRIAEVLNSPIYDADIIVYADSQEFKEMLAKIKNPISALTGFTYKKGNILSFGKFLKLFVLPRQKLAYQAL